MHGKMETESLNESWMLPRIRKGLASYKPTSVCSQGSPLLLPLDNFLGMRRVIHEIKSSLPRSSCSCTQIYSRGDCGIAQPATVPRSS